VKDVPAGTSGARPKEKERRREAAKRPSKDRTVAIHFPLKPLFLATVFYLYFLI